MKAYCVYRLMKTLPYAKRVNICMRRSMRHSPALDFRMLPGKRSSVLLAGAFTQALRLLIIWMRPDIEGRPNCSLNRKDDDYPHDLGLFCSPHLCVGFLFLVLSARSPVRCLFLLRLLCHTQLCRTQSFVHNSFTHNLSYKNPCTHNPFTHTHTHCISHTTLSHTTLSHTQPFLVAQSTFTRTYTHTQLFHTQLYHTQFFQTICLPPSPIYFPISFHTCFELVGRS